MKSLLGAFARVTSSLLFSGIFYIGWMAVFIPAFKTGNPVLQTIGWLSAPVVTAAGFAAGIWIAERLIGPRTTRFSRIFTWPFVGCTVGAGAVFWFGPMLIVFGMFLAGTASVVVREVVAGNREQSERNSHVTEVYVGNLPFEVTEEDLRQAFSQYGEVSSVKILTDRETGRPRGFGFVEMPDAGQAKEAIENLNETEIAGRSVTVNEARPKRERPRGGGGRGRL